MVCEQWVGFGHENMGGRAFGAEGITEEKAGRQESTRVPQDQPVSKLWKTGKRDSDIRQSLKGMFLETHQA